MAAPPPEPRRSPRENLGIPCLSNPDLALPLVRERVADLMAYLHTTDDGPIQAQVVYGQKHGQNHIKWQDKPYHADEPERKYPDHVGFVVRKISEGHQSPWTIHSIIVQSPQIKGILRKTLDGYPGVSPVLDKLTLSSPFKPMLHRWGAFNEAINLAGGSVKERISGFFGVLNEELDPYFKILQDADKHRVISHEHLWTIFAPGELAWWDLKQNHCVGKVRETKYDSQSGKFQIFCEQMVWDGFAIEKETVGLEIDPFTGIRPVVELSVVPLSRKLDANNIKELVLERGKRFLGLIGCHYREYLGLGEERDISSWDPPKWEGVSGRIVVDAALWNGKIGLRRKAQDGGSLSMEDSQLIICSPLVKGYSFSNKKWYKLFVSNVSDITWDNSFEGLVLGKVEKQLLLAFAKIRLDQTTGFDDLVSGKGKGVIILLSGPPGVGKTLTAESIADKLHRPLYPLSAGELGTSPEEVEHQLSQALTFCEEWDAVLLLDEADIFLEERSTSDLQRNGLVSIFLRLLEYFQGMMFLTTNRIQSIDPAFQSRIDMSIQYPGLSQDSRLRIWKNFIGKEGKFRDMDESKLRDLSSHELNGRQIKNVVKLARMLAAEDEEGLALEHLKSIIDMYQKNDAFKNT